MSEHWHTHDQEKARHSAALSPSAIYWRRLCRLVDPLERLVQAPDLVSLRLRPGQAWQAVLEKEGGIARLVALPAVRSQALSLKPFGGEGAVAEVQEAALHLYAPGSAEIAGQGWIALCYRAPLWIEHLLRDLPLRLLAPYRAPGGLDGLLEFSGLVLSEASLPRQREPGSQVRCHFVLPAEPAALSLLTSGANETYVGP